QGRCALHRAADLEIGLAGELWMDAALETDLRRALLPRFARALADFLEGEEVGHVAQAGLGGRLREGAERARAGADVRVVDVAIQEVGRGVADARASQLVRGVADRAGGTVTRPEQGDDLGFVQRAPGEDFGDRSVDARVLARRGARHRWNGPIFSRRPVAV